MTLLEIAKFNDAEAREYLENIRRPSGPVCPHCQSKNVTRLEGKKPVGDLTSNNAYMLMASLAWNLKAWLALSLPGSSDPAAPDMKSGSRPEPKRRLLTMEFRTFVNLLVRLPAQIVRTGRRRIVRLLGWNKWQTVLLRLAARLNRPLRC